MDFGVWWHIALLLTIVTVEDVRKRRIPNWITIPYLLAGVTYGFCTFGTEGIIRSFSGILVALPLPGIFWLLKGMGLGDVKLLAAVGAWLGPQQTGWVLFWTALAGGFIACGYALWRGSLDKALLGTGDLISHFARGRATRHRSITLDNNGALGMPYAPAIAIGTWMSFLMR